MFEENNLAKSLSEFGLTADPKVFIELSAAYTEVGRHYHDDSHVSACLSHFQKYRRQSERSHEIELAIWFHDAVYDTHKPDNEERSAAWAERYLIDAGADRDSTNRVVDMIMATKTHDVVSQDSKLMLDVDLGILGTPTSVFEFYDQSIRREYHWVPEEACRMRRAQVL